MTMKFDRRKFVQLFGAISAERELKGIGGGAIGAQTTAPRLAANLSVTVSRKKVIPQVKPFCWVDEGIHRVLDTIQEKGNVNTVFRLHL